MHLTDFQKQIEKRGKSRGLVYELRPGVDENDWIEAESRLGVRFPEQVRVFYDFCNGFTCSSPALEIHQLEDVQFIAESRLHFCTFDLDQQLCWDTSGLNAADQWNVVNPRTHYRVTLSMASLWSNKIWAWIDYRRPIWRPDPFQPE